MNNTQMTYILYFHINGEDGQFQGMFDTIKEAYDHMMLLINTKSRLDSYYVRTYQKDDRTTRYDYGAHNAFYTIVETEMLRLQDVDSDYVYKGGDYYPTEEIKEEWSQMTQNQRTGWFSTVLKAQSLDPFALIEHIVDEIANEGYDGLYDNLIDDIIDEDIAQAKRLLDRIAQKPSAKSYRPDKPISNER